MMPKPSEQRCPAPQPEAFTLVELLIVIGIIAVLIAMLLPALSRARRQSRLVACESNIRQILIATLNYAAENKGQLPPRWQAGAQPIFSAGGSPNSGTESFSSYTHMSMNGANGSGSYPGNIYVNQVGTNLGALLQGGFLDGANFDLDNFMSGQPNVYSDNYWDPTKVPVRIDPELNASDYNAVMGSTNNTGLWDLVYSSSYLFNPHWSYSNINGTWSGSGGAVYASGVSWYTNVNNFDVSKCLVCDDPIEQGLAAHPRNASYSFNMGFIDGHVSTVNDKLLANGTVAWPEPNGPLPATQNLTGLDDVIDVLETEADGRDPSTGGGDQAMPPKPSTGYPWSLRLQQKLTSTPFQTGSNGNTWHVAVPWE